MVEGLADQVLVAGFSNYLRTIGTPRMNTLDLNRLTIVPAGSASHIPYLVYLARGRDVEQPSVIVLLDNDAAGKDAQKALRRGGPKGRLLIKQDYVLMVSDLQGAARLPPGIRIVEIEDLIPPGLAAAAIRRYLVNLYGISTTNFITEESICKAWTEGRTLFDSIADVVQREVGNDSHVDKVGFARSVIELVQMHVGQSVQEISASDIEIFRHNTALLLAKIAHLQRQAERESAQERISQRIDREIKAFLRDHPAASRREDAILLLEEIESVLDDSLEADQVRSRLQVLRREHDLTEPKAGLVENLTEFAHGLLCLRYSAVNAVQEQTVEVPADVEETRIITTASASTTNAAIGSQSQPVLST
jgi:hypothetical protein